MDKYIDETKLKQALEEIFKVVDRANKYIDETEPWKLGKDDSQKPRLAAVLYNLLDAIRVTSALLAPFMPTVIPKVWEQIGASAEEVKYGLSSSQHQPSPRRSSSLNDRSTTT